MPWEIRARQSVTTETNVVEDARPVGNIRRLIREGGIALLIVRASKKLLSPLLEFGSVRLFKYDLDKVIPTARPRVEVVMRIADHRDVGGLVEAYESSTTRETIEDRFRNKEMCFIAEDPEGRCIHCRWAAQGEKVVQELGRRIRLATGEVFVYGSYTRLKYRRYGLAAAMHAFTIQKLSEAGLSTVYWFVRGDNPVGLKAGLPQEGELLGKLWFLRFRGFRPIIVDKCKAPHPPLAA